MLIFIYLSNISINYYFYLLFIFKNLLFKKNYKLYLIIKNKKLYQMDQEIN